MTGIALIHPPRTPEKTPEFLGYLKTGVSGVQAIRNSEGLAWAHTYNAEQPVYSHMTRLQWMPASTKRCLQAGPRQCKAVSFASLTPTSQQTASMHHLIASLSLDH